MRERTDCNRSEGNEVRAVCEYDRGRGLEGDEGTGRTRGVYAEALAHVFDFRDGFFVRWLKNCDKAEPRELAGEPNTAAEGFFSFATKERLARLKKTESCSEEAEGTQKT